MALMYNKLRLNRQLLSIPFIRFKNHAYASKIGDVIVPNIRIAQTMEHVTFSMVVLILQNTQSRTNLCFMENNATVTIQFRHSSY